MAMDIGSTQALIATDETVTAASTSTQGAEFTAVEINTKERKNGTVFFYVKGGNASATGNLIFTLQHSPDADRGSGSSNWYDLPTKTITLSGTSVINDTTASFKLNLLGYAFIRLKSIENTDASYTAEANVAIYMEG
jgi:hypothetical protein